AVYVVIQTQGLTKRGTTGSVLALDPRTKAVLWRHELPTGHVAGPAVRGGLLAVPVDSQYVILLDRATGAELAQVLSTAEAATFVRALPEGMFYGSRGVFLLSGATARGSRESPGYLLARLPPFVRPFYWYDLIVPSRRDIRPSTATTSCGAWRSRASARGSATKRSSCTTTVSCSGSTPPRVRCAGPTAIRRTPSRRLTRAA